MIELTEEKSCYTCKHSTLCKIRHAFNDALDVSFQHMTITPTETHNSFTVIYSAVASSCKEFGLEEPSNG